jgi:hypothetical protein
MDPGSAAHHAAVTAHCAASGERKQAPCAAPYLGQECCLLHRSMTEFTTLLTSNGLSTATSVLVRRAIESHLESAAVAFFS